MLSNQSGKRVKRLLIVSTLNGGWNELGVAGQILDRCICCKNLNSRILSGCIMIPTQRQFRIKHFQNTKNLLPATNKVKWYSIYGLFCEHSHMPTVHIYL